MEQKDSAIGDNCHRNILGMPDKEAKEYFIKSQNHLSGFRICRNGNTDQLTKNDLSSFISCLTAQIN
jgi:hypothetical protein